MERQRVVSELLRTGADLAAIESELDDEPARVVRKVAPGRAAYAAAAIVGAEPRELPEIAVAGRRRLEELVPASRAAVAKVQRDGDHAELDEPESEALEAIVLLMARPAILVQDGSFFPPPQPWTDALEARRAQIETVLGSVGRIEVSGHHSLDWVGTGWLAAPEVLMTNRHVAGEFARADAGAWGFVAGMSSRVDFAEELGAGTPREFAVTEVIGIHDQHDLALLRVEQQSDVGPLPSPIPIVAEPGIVEGSSVYVVGFPASDSRRNDPEEMRRIFNDIYNVKRLQPGKVRAVDETSARLLHDCSTLGGNSGSCVVDLESSRVIGLHFSGRYLEGNHAVALWQLADDPLVQTAGITYV